MQVSKLHGAITWCYNTAIRFFVISCSANIYKPFLNWRIWENCLMMVISTMVREEYSRYSESDILSFTHVLGYNIVRFGSVLHTLLKLKNKGNFFLLQKTIDAEVLKWRARRPETIVCFGLRAYKELSCDWSINLEWGASEPPRDVMRSERSRRAFACLPPAVV